MDYSQLTGRGTIMNSVYFIREDRDFTRTEQKIINFIIENEIKNVKSDSL